MIYVADTVAIVRHLVSHPKLGKQAKQIFIDADNGIHQIVIPGMTLAEIMILEEKNRISISVICLISLSERLRFRG